MYDIIAWLGSYKIFKKLFPKTADKIDKNLSVFAEASAEVLLYKPKQWQLIYKYKFETFKQELMEKYARIEPEKRCKPKTNIIFPALLNVTHVLDEKELKNMYQKLLLSAVNNETVKFVHPSFAYIISQMTPLDAKIFTHLDNLFYLVIFRIYDKSIKDSRNVSQNIYLDDIYSEVDDNISISINNLERLCLIQKEPKTEILLSDDSFSPAIKRFKQTKYYKEHIAIYGEKDTRIYTQRVYISELGLNFKKVCL